MKRQEERLDCPQCGVPTQVVEVEKQTRFRDVDIRYAAVVHRCAECGLELAGIDAAGTMQERMADAYRQATGLLSGAEIRELRQKLGLSQQALADALNIGVASIKRWETGVIQTKGMDTLLRSHLENRPCDEHTGHREFSIARIRLVLDAFERVLGRALLKKDDRMLYAAKYLWYADMAAFRAHGRSMTGATYAALPMGPQLNNYRDLVDEIFQADPGTAPPLSPMEETIIARVARAFPSNKAVFDASHREQIWRQRTTGAIIPYTQASNLTELPN